MAAAQARVSTVCVAQTWLRRTMDTSVVRVPMVSVVTEKRALTLTTASYCRRRMTALYVEATASAQTPVRTLTIVHASRAISLLKEHAKRFVLATLRNSTTATNTLRATTWLLAVTAVLAMQVTPGQASNVLTQMAARMLHASVEWRALMLLHLATVTRADRVRLDSTATEKSATTSGTVWTTLAERTVRARTLVPTRTSARAILVGETSAVRRRARAVCARRSTRAS